MKSLRLRFFVISWPIVVAAVLLVALGVERWATVQLEHVETLEVSPPDRALIAAWSDSVAAIWPELAGSMGAERLSHWSRSQAPPVDLVVLDTAGALMASSDPLTRIVTAAASPGGVVYFERRSLGPRGEQEARQMQLRGWPVAQSGASALGYLYVLPIPPPAPVIARDLQANLRRTLWWSVFAASLAAAGAALLLAGPLVRQIHRLSAAAASIRAGALDARVPVGGSDELAQLEHSFNAMAQTLEQAEAHKRNLVIDVAHELRTPLTNILGSIEAMQDGLRTPDAEALGSLREEAGLLASLVSELQELSLAESNQLRFEMDDIDAVEAARATVDAARHTAAGITLHGPSSSEPIMLRADAQRLAQVLRNLLRNAITHTPPGGDVRVDVTAVRDRVLLTVTDTGRGIPAQQLGLIWERFHRVDASRDRAVGGMGLGLALVRQLVHGMGGSVGVESREGEGSTFRVELAAAP